MRDPKVGIGQGRRGVRYWLYAPVVVLAAVLALIPLAAFAAAPVTVESTTVQTVEGYGRGGRSYGGNYGKRHGNKPYNNNNYGNRGGNTNRHYQGDGKGRSWWSTPWPDHGKNGYEDKKDHDGGKRHYDNNGYGNRYRGKGGYSYGKGQYGYDHNYGKNYDYGRGYGKGYSRYGDDDDDDYDDDYDSDSYDDDAYAESDGSTSADTESKGGEAAAAEAGMASDGAWTVNIGEDPALGSFLMDSDGRTLYRFDRDTEGVSNCVGECATLWPPVVAPEDGSWTPGEGISGEFGSITREDGIQQLTYNGQPLYYYANDVNPGDKTGHGVAGIWWMVTP